MIRFVLSVFGGIFSWVTTAVFAAALTVGAVLYIYAEDLPSTESLASYQPPIISRIYSGEGRVIDEFAKERRLFAPSEEIPDLVKQAFVSAEDKNFYTHGGFDARGIAAAVVDAVRSRGAGAPRRLHDHPAGDEELPPVGRPQRRAQGQGAHPGDAHRGHALQGRHPGAVPQRDLSRAEQLRRGGGGADLLQQDAGRAGASRRRPISPRSRRSPRACTPFATASGCWSGATTCCARCARTATSRRPLTSRRGRRRWRRCRGARSRASAPPCRRATTSPTRSAASSAATSARRSSSPPA